MAARTFLKICAGIAALALSGGAFALKSDKNQATNIDANYSKRVESRTGAATDPDVTDLDGNVLITKGSIKMTSAHATIYTTPSASKSANAGKISRNVLTGKPAHMQQVHDDDCSLMTAEADKIDYNPQTNIAELTGNVKVVQGGRGEFHGEHMLYNTDTGDMESGQVGASSGRIHMVMEAQTTQTAASANNCGFPGGTAPAAKPAEKPAAKTADDKKASKP